MSQHHDQRFPNEHAEYRSARDALLAEEIELRRQVEKVSEMRRSLPLGGALKEDYVFQDISGEDTRFSELFSDKSANLLVYSFMYKSGGNVCPACTSLLDSLNGSAPHIKQNLNFAVTARASAEELKAWAKSRNWSNLTLFSSGKSTYNFDYKAEDDEKNQLPMMNVFRKSDDGIFHTWASELFYAPNDEGQHPRHADQVWPLWNVYDLTPDGRPSDWFPANSYDR